MRYSKYTEEDFIKDEYFQKWILDADVMTHRFWENWLAQHPEKKTIIEKSKRLVLLMNFDNDKLPDKDFDAMWRNIIERRNDTEIEDQPIRLVQKSKQYTILKVAAVFIGIIATGFALNQIGPF